MKYEWRKLERDFYSTKKKPVILNIPKQKFISLSGIGNPNGSEFSQKIQVLYPAAYGIKGAYKKVANSQEYDDYVVFPLEGVWSLTKKGQQLDYLDKNEFSYDIMIRIPDFVSDDLVKSALQAVKEKKSLPEIDNLEIKEYPAMEAAQILHVGSYDDEPASFEKIDDLVASENKQRISKVHREIYLSDVRRVAPDKLKTILRYQIK